MKYPTADEAAAIAEKIPKTRLFEGTPDEWNIGVTKATMERIIKLSPCPAEAIALYLLYSYTCKWQKNVSAYATAKYVQAHFRWGRGKFQKAKNSLKELGLIEDVRRSDKKTGLVTGWYVKVRYAQSTGSEIHPLDNPQAGKSTTDTSYSYVNTLNSYGEARDSEDLITVDPEWLDRKLDQLAKNKSPLETEDFSQQPNDDEYEHTEE